MTATTAPALNLLRAANPYPPSDEDLLTPEDEHAWELLATILRSAQPAEAALDSRRSPRFLLLGAAAALAMGLVGTILGWPAEEPGSSMWATPAPLAYVALTGSDAATELRSIATRTRALSSDVGSGQVTYVETRSWSLSSPSTGEANHTEVTPEVKRVNFGPGQPAFLHLQVALSTEPQALAAALAVGHPASNGPVENLAAVLDAYRQNAPDPQLRAALLEYVATTPGLALTGRTVDRAGRTGIAVSIDSDYSGLPTRYTLIFDPQNGRLLAAEDTLTASAEGLRVPVPSVIGYTTFIANERR